MIIHRDLKPGNILVSADGERLLPRVIDFGIAKALDPDLIGTGSVTVEGQFLGTPHYMSPEQIREGVVVTPQTDLWSVGVVLFEALSGKVPFAPAEQDKIKILMAVMGDQVAPELPDIIDEVLSLIHI